MFFSFQENLPRGLVAQGLVGSFRVVEGEPISNSFSGPARRIVFVEIHFFIFQASPEPFRENIVRGSAFPIHADLDVPGKETLEIAVAGEVRSMVTIENGRRSGRKGPIHRVQDKRISKVWSSSQERTNRECQSMMATKYIHP